jgi:hypothetical protein
MSLNASVDTADNFVLVTALPVDADGNRQDCRQNVGRPHGADQRNFVRPGSARGMTSWLPLQSRLSGKSFSCEFSA